MLLLLVLLLPMWLLLLLSRPLQLEEPKEESLGLFCCNGQG